MNNFKCVNCGGILNDPDIANLTIRCLYCGSKFENPHYSNIEPSIIFSECKNGNIIFATEDEECYMYSLQIPFSLESTKVGRKHKHFELKFT